MRSRTDRTRRRLAVTAATASLLLAAACGEPFGSPSGPVDLTMWSHGGTPAERETLDEQVRRWNSTQSASRVELVQVPEGDYGHTVQTAITGRSLPDIVEVDGPLVASYAYQGAIRPLDDHVDAAVVDSLLPSLVVQGTYDDELYAVGAFESSIALYADRRRLEQVGARVPTGASDAWTAAEFAQVLSALAADDPDGRVLDVKRNYGVGEWLTYGFSPLLWSGGADLLDRGTGVASGTLDSPEAVSAMRVLASWRPFIDANTDDEAFVERDVALSWVGHWAYTDYAAALGDDLVLLPLPDLGLGSRNSQGSWAWALSASGEHPEEATQVLEFLVSDPEVRRATAANGAVPGTWAAVDQDDRFAAGGDLAPFAAALSATCGDDPRTPGCVSVARPSTPGYPTLSNAVATAVDAVLDGADPESALREAARVVDADAAANEGYRPPSDR